MRSITDLSANPNVTFLCENEEVGNGFVIVSMETKEGFNYFSAAAGNGSYTVDEVPVVQEILITLPGEVQPGEHRLRFNTRG